MNARWDRHDICEAWHLFISHWHGGQKSPQFKKFGQLHRTGFRPSPRFGYSSLSDNGKQIYNNLVKKGGYGG